MYRVKTLDLSVATPNDGVAIVAPGQTISEIAVLYMPVGNQFQLKLGTDNTDFFTIQREFSMEPASIREKGSGIFFRNLVPQAGVTVELILVFGDALGALA
jgi:hypothetical protein